MLISRARSAVRQIIQLESFMAFALTVAGILARLRALSEVLVLRVPKKSGMSSATRFKVGSLLDVFDKVMISDGLFTLPKKTTPVATPSAGTSGTTTPLSGANPQNATLPSQPTPPGPIAAQTASTSKKAKEDDDIDEIFAGL